MSETQIIHRLVMFTVTVIAAAVLNIWWLWLIASINGLLLLYWLSAGKKEQ